MIKQAMTIAGAGKCVVGVDDYANMSLPFQLTEDVLRTIRSDEVSESLIKAIKVLHKYMEKEC